MLTIGVTGGVACGKTTVSKFFEAEGAYRIDADRIARELVQPGSPAWKELIRVFGKGILEENGSVNRKQLANLVFSHPKKRRLLNYILHPRIQREMEKRARAIGKKDPNAIILFDVPLLVETGFHRKVDRVVVVTSTETQQIQRLKKRAGLSEEEARRIISSQLEAREKEKVADFVIRNEGSLEKTRRSVHRVFQELRKVLSQKRKRMTQPHSLRKKRGGLCDRPLHKSRGHLSGEKEGG